MAEEVINLIRIWEEFASKQTDFKLNPDKSKVEGIAKGVLENEKNHGLKYCPCRMRVAKKEEDLKIVCPCYFKIQNTWKEKGECWCGLFIKK